MPSNHTSRLQRMAPYFIIGWLLGVMLVAQPSLENHATRGALQTRSTEFYKPPLHPATVALGQALFSVLGLAVFSRRRIGSPVPVRQS